MLSSDGVGALGVWLCPLSLRSRFRDELFHAADNFRRVVFGFDDRLPVLFADFDFGTGSDTEPLPQFLREDDSPFRIYLRHVPT